MLEAYVLRKLNGPELAIKILSAFFMQIAFAAFVIFLFVVIVDQKKQNSLDQMRMSSH